MKKVLFLVNRDFVLYNFRIELVQRLLDEKYEVYICLPYGEKVDEMVKMGCKYIPVEIDGRGTNPVRDFKLILDYRKIFKEVRPDIILMYTTKVCIYGGIVAGHLHIPYLENISGLGTAVENKSPIQKFMIQLYKNAVKKADCVFFQNNDNFEFFKNYNIKCRKYKIIPGSGVNLERWHAMEYPTEKNGIHFLFIARVIREKGIEEYLKCARYIHKKYPETVFHVLGPCDGNYKNILDKYQKDGVIRYHGMVQDTREFLKSAHCTIHPSFYPEGISNVLLESSACCRPVITTDRSGCKDTVNDGVSGYICKQQDTKSLIACVEKFLSLSTEERRQMGLQGREKVRKEFDRQIVINQYMKEIVTNLHTKEVEKLYE